MIVAQETHEGILAYILEHVVATEYNILQFA